MTVSAAGRPELWGGLECSVVRIGDTYRNEFAETGHDRNLADLDRVAGLGITTIRYPVLWEQVSPDSPDVQDWQASDRQMERLRKLGLRPIAGLVHHGSGPRYTSLVDPQFPALLAAHAARVAERYPWISLYTPVNEPLTTARFSGLYGHWYPHGRDIGTFLRCLVNECLATLLAMRAIRRVNPQAMLVQTEDLGKVFSTDALRGQADYENARRWLSLDLLCGRVDERHPWHAALIASGIGAEDLALLATGEGRPDIIGINYYATSERYLDEDLARYPACFHGGNGRMAYADVEALRIDLAEGETGVRARLREAWERYRLPLAITEVHHGSTREEQLRWLAEVWADASSLAAEGVDLRAVTVWSLLGAVDWNSLLTERRGFYEPGAFDVRGPAPRLTAIGKALKQLAKTGCIDHPVLDQKGWWRRDGRHYQPSPVRAPALLKRPRMILIAGAAGRLGREITAAAAHRGLEIACPDAQEFDVTRRDSVEAVMAQLKPWAVIDAAFSRRSDALAEACARRELPFTTFSSDRVFDGALSRPYVESDRLSPACRIGRSTADVERRVAVLHPEALIIRMGGLFGPDDEPARILERCAAWSNGQAFLTASYLPDVVRVALDLLVDGETGTWHLPSHGAMPLSEIERYFTLPEELHVPSAHLVRLESERARLMPSLAEALERQRDILAGRVPEPSCAIAAE